MYVCMCMLFGADTTPKACCVHLLYECGQVLANSADAVDACIRALRSLPAVHHHDRSNLYSAANNQVPYSRTCCKRVYARF